MWGGPDIKLAGNPTKAGTEFDIRPDNAYTALNQISGRVSDIGILLI